MVLSVDGPSTSTYHPSIIATVGAIGSEIDFNQVQVISKLVFPAPTWQQHVPGLGRLLV